MAGGLGAAVLAKAARPKGLLVDTHIHLFDAGKFPYHRNAVYRPPAQTLESYAAFVRESRIDHAIIVHPEPYQDDHSYLEYCFAHEPSPWFFKGTCLFDPADPKTPARMEALVKKNPGRIVALRVHEMEEDRKKPPEASGAIRNRDMKSPGMLAVWRKAHSLGLAVQMHCLPRFAPQIRDLALKTPGIAVVLDHIGRYGQGTPAEYEQVLKLAELPRTFMKFSSVGSSSKQPYPHRDMKPVARRIFDAFGPDRIIWGVLGMNRKDFDLQAALFDEFFAFASEADRAKIRGLNAMKLYGFKS